MRKTLNEISVERVIALLGLVVVLATSTSVQAEFKVVGYFPSWSENVDTLDYDKLTHINYAFLTAHADGTLNLIDFKINKFSSMVSRAHDHGIKAMISVGGWGKDRTKALSNLAKEDHSRAAFIANLMSFVDQYNLDGVDIDWEFPDSNNEDKNNFKVLMQELHAALSSKDKLLTAAVRQNDFNHYVDSEVMNAVDFVNIMAYADKMPHSTYETAVEVLQHWRVEKDFPKAKVVLGVPFYSRVVIDAATKEKLGLKSNVITKSYNKIIEEYGPEAAWVDDMGGESYNGIPTLKAKTQLSLDQAGGIMYWDTSKDTGDETSLMSAAWGVVKAYEAKADSLRWARNRQYEKGDVVFYEGSYYIAEHANPGYKPTVSTWYWDPVAEWDTNEYYTSGDIVLYKSELYIAEHDNPGYKPTVSTWYWDPVINRQTTCENPGQWKQANLTNYESYPEPGSEECVLYNGCQWAGYFAGLEGQQTKEWVAAHNIAAVHEDDFNQYNGKTLQLNQGDSWINVVVYDMCADADCDGCCSQNRGEEGFLIDIEKNTMNRFGVGSGSVKFRTCD